MAKSIFNKTDREEILERLGKLQPDSARQWGKMNASQMVCHLTDSLRVGTGQAPAKSKNSPFSNPVLRWLVVYAMPWPKGKAQTVPEMLATQPGNWQADINTLKEQLRGAVQRGADGAWAEHPAFGKISGKMYGTLIYKHFNHHLSQFGA
ncbi:MAG TPA: DUF1569 domain-containing protein [Longimicrobiales bacterium]|nr:DUF1569 domain-containing protein [Longimicrobiales bacterium]